MAKKMAIHGIGAFLLMPTVKAAIIWGNNIPWNIGDQDP